MISRSKLYHYFWRLGTQTRTNNERISVGCLIEVHSFLFNSFCTIAEVTESEKIDDSIVVAESPELPSWVKSPNEGNQDGKNIEDDDFVLPSMLYWMENYKLGNQDFDVKSIVSDIVDTDVDKVSKVLKILFNSPDDVVEALQSCDVDVTESMVTQILKRFSCEWKPAFGFFKWTKLEKGFKHTPDLYNLMVDNMGKTKKFNLMWELVEEMNQLGGYVTIVTMSKVMRRLGKAGKYEEAIDAFKKLEKYGVEKDINAVNMLMDALVKGGSVEHAENVFLEYKDYVTPNLHTFNILVHGWCKSRQIEKAKKTMYEMKNHGFTPDAVTYTSLIEAYCLDKDFRKVDATLEEMQKKGCPPNVVTYTIIMKKTKETNKALEVYEKMKKNGCVPDSSFYSSLMYILGKAGRFKDSRELFEDMLKQGVARDAITYNTMITIAAQHLQEEDALKLLRKMEEDQFKPNIDTYLPLLKMCCKMKRMKVLSFLLTHMFKNDVSIDLGTYALLIRGLCRNGKPERACFFFKELVQRGFVPAHITYKKLVEELEKKGIEKEKTRIEELMLKAKEKSSDHYSGGNVEMQDK